MKRKTRRNHVPNLDRHSGSWIVTRIKDGKVIGEFFTRRNVERFDPKKTLVETAYQYLGRVNADIKSRRKNPRRTRRNSSYAYRPKLKQKVYPISKAKEGWTIETVIFGQPSGNVYKLGGSAGYGYYAWADRTNHRVVLSPKLNVIRVKG